MTALTALTAARSAACMGTAMTDAPTSTAVAVIDTNVVLDLWLFADPRFAPLKAALENRSVVWLATAAMRAELARVLTHADYPQLQKALAQRSVSANDVLAAFDAYSTPAAAAPKAPIMCRDPDDQIFIDLAVQHHATLYSKDRAVRVMRKRLVRYGAGLNLV